jgi:dTDP-4-dehydrorhamnose reductase
VRVFVTGCRGLVGSALLPALRSAGHDVAGADLPECDVTRPESLDLHLEGRPADWVVNLAAFTDVDGSERDPDRAMAVNGEGARQVALACARSGARMLQVSTDYVFDGHRKEPYGEQDEPNPLSAYGRSKLDGERAVAGALAPGRWLVVRGQSLYGSGRKSFPDAILGAAAVKTEIPVVIDQVVQPTWAADFAGALAALLERERTGVFHFAASDACTWNEFAVAVLELAGERRARVTPTTAAALGRPAPRPASSRFSVEKFSGSTGIRPRRWREMLHAYLRSTGRAA